MRGKIRRLAVFVMIATIGMFMAVATASAGSPGHYAIQGQYVFTGTGSCLVSPTGFTDYVPNNPDLAFLSMEIFEGVYTFEKDGSGTFQDVSRFVGVPPGGSIDIANVTWRFKYKMIDRHRFTKYLEPGTYPPYPQIDWIAGPNSTSPFPTNYFYVEGACDGVVSNNGETITITCGHPILMFTLCDPSQPPCVLTPFQSYCTFSHVLTRVDK
jgi:hypothetical protein